MYRECNDNEIIYMIQENDDNLGILLEKYKPLITKISGHYLKIGKRVGMDFDDLMQIGNMSLITSIKYYNESMNTSFYTYALRCIENNIKTELRKETTQRKIALNNAMSLYQIIPGTDKTLIDHLKDDKEIDPLDYLITEESQLKYVKFINSFPLEMSIAFEMKLGGFSNEEIAKFLHLDKKTVSQYSNYIKSRLCLN